ncbi:hypothetical protein APUTEX25_002654, partial [Auxenochlorella protothecoides]
VIRDSTPRDGSRDGKPGRNVASWSIQDACTWLESIGLGQYRKRFVHHAVDGRLLLGMTAAHLKEDLGIGSLGHRHAIVRARDELRGGALAETRPASPIGGPVQPAAASSLMRVHAQRARLARALERAGARQAHRAATAQHAQHSVELASDEVRRLEARIAALDCQLAAGSVGLSKQGSALGLAAVGPGMDLAVPPTGEEVKACLTLLSQAAAETRDGLKPEVESSHEGKEGGLAAPILGSREAMKLWRDLGLIRSELEAVDPVLAAALANPSPSQPLLATLRRAAEALHPPLPSAAVVAVERCEAAPAAAARLSDALRCARFARRLSRAQRFVRSMRDDMAQRAQRAAALQAELYARAPRLLSAEERDRFVSRLMDDARRRAQNREEIAAKAELERTRPAWEGLKGRQAKTPVPLRRGSKRR